MLEILAGMLRTAAPILLAAMGGVVSEKSGCSRSHTRASCSSARFSACWAST